MDLNRAAQRKMPFRVLKTTAKKPAAAKIKNALMDLALKMKKHVLVKAARRNLNRI
jgi:hypothetical protein